MNTFELALRDGVPCPIDFANPAPGANHSSVLVERVRRPRPVELTGSRAAVAAQRRADA